MPRAGTRVVNKDVNGRHILALRVDVKGAEDLAKTRLKAFIDDNLTDASYLFSLEHGTETGKPHVQGICYSRESDNILRPKFRKYFPENGSTEMACAYARDEFLATRYVCKGDTQGNPPVVWFKAGIKYDNDFILKMHTDYWEYIAKKEDREKQKKMTNFEIINEVVRQSKLKKFDWRSDRVAISKEIIRLLTKNFKPFDVFSTRRMLNLVCSHLDPTVGFVDEMSELVAGQM